MKELYDKLIELSLKRALFYPSSEIYGSIAGFYDYGSVGVKVKKKLEDYWRWFFLKSLGENFHEIQPTNLMPESVFKASGHLEYFEDPIVECSKCGFVERADQLLEGFLHKTFEGLTSKQLDELIKKHGIRCPECGGEFKEVSSKSLMFGFSTRKGKIYLRPETAQGAFVNFRREFKANRERIPIGLAIIGKAFRNEISPRQALFRTNEFTQAELQVFFDPEDTRHENFSLIKKEKVKVVLASEREKGEQELSAEQLVNKGYFEKYVYYMFMMKKFYNSLGFTKLHFYEKNEEERAFYNKFHFDCEVFFKCFDSFKEVAGLHYRTDYDLKNHEKHSNQSMQVFANGKKFVPHVIELSFGIDRTFFALLDNNFKEDGKRKWLSLPKHVAPFAAGIYPLVSKDGLEEKAKQVYELVSKQADVFYDDKGSIGKRYARADEIGVMYGITIDYDTMQDNAVTIRERDSTKQERVKISELVERLSNIK